jgi:hypothetical protein
MKGLLSATSDLLAERQGSVSPQPDDPSIGRDAGLRVFCSVDFAGDQDLHLPEVSTLDTQDLPMSRCFTKAIFKQASTKFLCIHFLVDIWNEIAIILLCWIRVLLLDMVGIRSNKLGAKTADSQARTV